MSHVSHVKKLKNAPLQEVIFEVKWDLEVSDGDTLVDPRFSLAAGNFHQEVKEHFPFDEKNYSDAIPVALMAHRPKWRFRAVADGWPIVQIGPGLLSVNDSNENYEWNKTFKPNIKLALDALYKSYGGEVEISQLSLLYIDAIPIPEGANRLDFVRENLQIDIGKKFSTPGKIDKVNYGERSELEDGSSLVIEVSTGKRAADDTDILLWQTAIQISENLDREGLEAWVENAHTLTSQLFKEMVSPELYEHFNK